MSTVCTRCGECLVNPDLPCMFCVGERRQEAVETFVAASGSDSNASLLARAEATETLRNLGHSAKEVLQVRAKVLDGLPVEEIVGWLGEVEREGVAA